MENYGRKSILNVYKFNTKILTFMSYIYISILIKYSSKITIQIFVTVTANVTVTITVTMQLISYSNLNNHVTCHNSGFVLIYVITILVPMSQSHVSNDNNYYANNIEN